jgi:hypothetical protein
MTHAYGQQSTDMVFWTFVRKGNRPRTCAKRNVVCEEERCRVLGKVEKGVPSMQEQVKRSHAKNTWYFRVVLYYVYHKAG